MVKDAAAAIVLASVIAAPATAWGMGGGGPGCTNLPLYNRALGALQGMTSACDMSVEEARRIIAAQQGGVAADRPDAPRPRAYDHRHRMRTPHQ